MWHTARSSASGEPGCTERWPAPWSGFARIGSASTPRSSPTTGRRRACASRRRAGSGAPRCEWPTSSSGAGRDGPRRSYSAYFEMISRGGNFFSTIFDRLRPPSKVDPGAPILLAHVLQQLGQPQARLAHLDLVGQARPQRRLDVLQIAEDGPRRTCREGRPERASPYSVLPAVECERADGRPPPGWPGCHAAQTTPFVGAETGSSFGASGAVTVHPSTICRPRGGPHGRRDSATRRGPHGGLSMASAHHRRLDLRRPLILHVGLPPVDPCSACQDSSQADTD